MENIEKKKILVVEDEEALLQALTDTFSENGYEVLKAKNGVEALSVALKNHPDLIILDILMPEMDGMSMVKNLRADNWGSKVPVIILTNINPESNHILQSIVESQPAYYLIKANVELSEIVEKANSIIRN